MPKPDQPQPDPPEARDDREDRAEQPERHDAEPAARDQDPTIPGAPEPENTPAEEQPAPQASEDPADRLRRERDELESRLVRVSADFQNYVRRAQHNAEAARDQQLMDIAKSLVTVLDHFDRALEVDPEKTPAQSLLDGVRIVRDELLRTLQRFGVERIDAEVGEPFDPNRHEALMQQPSEEFGPNHVAQQMQPGYALRDKTVRPAKVSITQ